MNLSPSTTYIILALFVIAYLSFDTYTLSKKIHCTFRRRDNTKLTKWAKMTQGNIEFDGGIYRVRPDRTYQQLYTGGLHILVPTWIRCSDYRWDSQLPLDPKTFSNEYATPEEQKQLEMEDDIRGLHEGNRKAQGAAKGGALSGWMPIIVLCGFLILGYLTYSNMKKADQVGFALNVVQQQLGKLLAK